jgi:PucR C-terminal helix-turn-helix domain
VAENEDRTRPFPGLLDWERQLAASTARRFERIEPEELEAELDKTIIELKTGLLTHVRHWGKYLATALRRTAINWKRRRRLVSQKELAGSELETEFPLPALPEETDFDRRVEIARFRNALQPELQKVLEVLERHNFNQTEASKELGIHRNTLSARLGRIKQIAREFRPDECPAEQIVRKARSRDAPIVLRSSFLRQISQMRLSASAWCILLWIIRELSRRKKAIL